MKLEGGHKSQYDGCRQKKLFFKCAVSDVYDDSPALHGVQVPQLHDLLLSLVDVCEVLDLLQ